MAAVQISIYEPNFVKNFWQTQLDIRQYLSLNRSSVSFVTLREIRYEKQLHIFIFVVSQVALELGRDTRGCFLSLYLLVSPSFNSVIDILGGDVPGFHSFHRS